MHNSRSILYSAISTFSLISGLAFFPVQPAYALQTSPEEPLAEGDEGRADIVVTARKRDERLIDVPVAVSAVSSATLNEQNLKDLTAISTEVPNLIVGRVASSAGASLTIRGIGTSFNDAGVDQTVSLSIDGLQGARGFISSVAFFDLAQVEVLKGPQALFFGKNSPAGVVSLTSNDPTKSFILSGTAGYEFVADERYLETILSGPLTDTFGARLALRFSAMEGYFKNRAQAQPNPFSPGNPLPGPESDRSPNGESYTGRLTLKWQPTPVFNATWKILGNHYADNGLSRQFQVTGCPPGRVNPVTTNGTITVSDPTGDCSADKYQSSGDMPPAFAIGVPGSNGGRVFTNVDSLVSTLKLNYEVGPVALTSVTGYSKTDYKGFTINDHTSYSTINGVITEDSRIFTQELRVISEFDFPVNVVLGVYYDNADRTSLLRLIGPNRPLLDPVTNNNFNYERNGNVKSESISGFGQLIWKVFPNLEATAGARYTHESKDTTIYNSYVNPANVAQQLPQGLILTNRFRDNNISPEVTLAWHPSIETTVYGAYKTGYKSGGATVPTSLTRVAADDNIGFGPEKAKGVEVGFKGQLSDRRLTVTSALYSYKFTGLQLVTGVLLPNGLPSTFVRNAASARTKGVELDLNYRATRRLTLDFSGAYNRARFIDFPKAICYAGQTGALGCGPDRTQDLSGYRLSRAPKWVLTGGASYAMPLNDALELRLEVDGRYSSSYTVQDDGHPLAIQGSYTTIDAVASLQRIDDRWSIALIGKNLTDEYWIITSNSKSGGELAGTVSRGREIGLQVSFRM